MEQSAPSRNLGMLCSSFGYSRQAYYQHIKIHQQKVFTEDLLVQEVHRIRKTQKRIGSRKLLIMMRPFMKQHTVTIGRDAFIELLGHHGLLVSKRSRRGPKTTFSNHWFRRYPNIIKEFIPNKANELWVSDITYIHSEDGFSYLSLVTDGYSRKIVGFHLGQDLSAQGCVKALKMALENNPLADKCIHHSDRGIQYCSQGYVELLRSNNIQISMTESGDPRENALAERMNGILKEELLEACYPNFEEAKKALMPAINIYNDQRPHSSVDMLTPAIAHDKTGELKKHWKNYYTFKKRKEVFII